mgnify:CR=1 FL=1
MAFKNLLDVLELPVLKLQVGDRLLEIPEVSADTFVRLTAINANMKEDPHPDAEVFALALGPDLYAKVQTELPPSQVLVVGVTAYLWQLRMHALAEEFWNSGGKALRAVPKTRTRTRNTTPTGAATTTRRRASGSGTTTRRNSNANTTG